MIIIITTTIINLNAFWLRQSSVGHTLCALLPIGVSKNNEKTPII